MRKDYSTFTLLRRFLNGNWGLVWVSLSIYLINSIIVTLIPLFQQVYTDNVITRENPEWFMPLMICYTTLLLLLIVSFLIVNAHRKRHVSSLMSSTSSRYIWTVLRLPLSFVDRISSGELTSRYGNSVNAVWRIESDIPALILWIEPLICIWLLTYYNTTLALIEVAVMLLLLASIWVNTKVQKGLTRISEAAVGHLQSVTLNGVDNIETIKAVGGEQEYFRTWDHTYAETLNARIKSNTAMILVEEIPEVMYQLSNVILLCAGSWLILQGELTPGMLLAMQGLMSNMVFPLGKIMTTVQKLMYTHSMLERVAEVTDCDSELEDIKVMKPEDLPTGGNLKLTGDIELRNVTFGYEREQPPILKDFSLSIKAGQQVAFVGFSGCGKSTIAKLISGLYDPWEGEVLFDGQPRRQINRMLFVNSLSVVNQDITLFEGNISDNIKMWDPSIDDTTMINAAKAAQIHSDIAERHGAYRSEVTENGNNFSGGQRQRIEIATALAKEPTILILDEATSALDTKAETLVMDHLRRLGITLVVIAHRLSTIRHCDNIYVMEHGKIMQQGTYDDLAAKEGLFKELVKHA